MKITDIPITKLHPFEGHPYKVLDDGEMDNLIGSVRENGVLSPLIVRPLEGTDEYEVISGHRRLHAAERAGMRSVPAVVYELSRDEAAVLLVDSNLHREHILPSEKAFAYKLKLEALAHQGKTSRQVGEKWSVAQVSEAANESQRQIHRYIRLTKLVPELLQMMDEGRIAFSVGVELSFLSEQSQRDLLDAIDLNDCTPSYFPSMPDAPGGGHHHRREDLGDHVRRKAQPAGADQAPPGGLPKVFPRKLYGPANRKGHHVRLGPAETATGPQP